MGACGEGAHHWAVPVITVTVWVSHSYIPYNAYSVKSFRCDALYYDYNTLLSKEMRFLLYRPISRVC